MSKRKKLFADSMVSKRSELMRVTRNYFETSGILGEEEEIISDFEFYNDDVKRSQKLPDYKFTNFVSNQVHQDIRIRMQELAENPSVIENNVTQVDRNEKVDKCLDLYVDISQETHPMIIKSTMHTSTGIPTTVRVYSKADLINQDNGKLKALYRIVLIDPFHLVIPSEHNGVPKHQVEERVFQENKNNNTCMSAWIKSMFE